MKDKNKTKEQLIKEAAEMRQRISGLEKSERELRNKQASLEKYRILFSHIHDVAYICDTEGNVMFVNDVFETLTGHKPEDFIGKPFAPLFDEKNLDKVMNAYEMNLKGENTHIALRFKDTGIICEYKTIPYRDKKGNIIGVMGIGRDITERKQAEEALRKAKDELEMNMKERTAELESAVELLYSEIVDRKVVEQQLIRQKEYINNILESVTHPLYVINVNDYRVVHMNSAARHDSIPEGITCYELSHGLDEPCDGKDHKCVIREIQKTGKPISVEHVHHHNGNSPRTVEVHGYPIFNGDGIITQVVEYILDITDRKNAEMALEEKTAQLNTVIESLPFHVFGINSKGRYFIQNASSMETWGSIIGKRPEDCAPDRETLALWQENNRRAFSGETVKDEVDFPLPNGKMRSFYNIITPIRDENKIWGILGINIDIAERKEHENQILEQRNLFETILNASPDIVVLKDRKAVYQSVNSAFCEFIGRPRDEIIGKTDFDLFPEKEAGIFTRDDARVMKTGHLQIQDEKVTGKEGIKWLQVAKTPVRDTEGNVTGILCSVRDITERKETEEALRESEERWRLLSEHSPDHILTLDRDLNIQFVNFASPGMTVENLIGTPLYDYVSEERRDEVKETLEKALHTPEISSYETTYQTPAGDTIYYESRVAQRLEGKKVVGLTVVARDITKRKRANEKVKEQLQFLQTLLDTIPNPVFYKDRKGKYTGCNRAFEDFLGRPASEIIGKTVYDMGPKEIADKYFEKDRELFENPGEQCYEWSVKRKDGEIRDVVFYKASIMNIDGKVDGLIGVALDITERKLMEEEIKKHSARLNEMVKERTAELVSANEKLQLEINERRRAEAEAVRAAHLAALGELAAGVAHEINNPINGVINYAQIIFNKSKEGSNEKEIAGQIIKESDRVASIVHNLLFFARDRRQRKCPVQVHEIISDTLALSKTQLSKDGIILKVNVPPNLPPVIAHTKQIEIVFLNIISNARYALNHKYEMAENGKCIEISAVEKTVEGCPCISVAFYDNGEGIPSGILDRILNPFFTTKPGNQGTGLGLSISHGIINDHGGRLLVDSVEGEYTKVMIDLPLK
jgi:PAS domain S-box-containing protein